MNKTTTTVQTTKFDINKTLKSVTLYTWLASGVLFSCYVYFIGAITFSVIKERGLEEDKKTLISTIGEQELQYLNSQKTLTKDYAVQNGFVPAHLVSFASPQKAFAWNVGR